MCFYDNKVKTYPKKKLAEAKLICDWKIEICVQIIFFSTFLSILSIFGVQIISFSITQEYSWCIGTDIGLTDLQEYTSTGTNATGTNDTFEGLLENNKTYYISVNCTNDAGLTTTWQDTKGKFY